MSGVKLCRMCYLVASAFLCVLLLGTFEIADAKKHGRRGTEYLANHDFADPLKNRRVQKTERGGHDGKKPSTSEHGHRGPKVVVRTDKGRYRGRVREVMDTKVATFLGMRYGEAPIGKMRFKKSVAARKWSKIREAVSYPNTCVQWRDNSFGKGYPGTEMWNPNTAVDEDCLFLNVWAPLSRDFSEKKMPTGGRSLPVLVWIYGGGFYSGTSSLDVYDGSWLAATQDVVVVSMNYRVAAFGFLTFGTKDSPGNAGLWDQHLALRWIRDNIHHFRGDPTRITIAGESAGAASVSMHILSSHSNKLFQGAIMQSASALSPWAVLPMDVMKNRAKKLAGLLGCNSDSNDADEAHKEVMQCMYSADAQNMANVEIAMEDLGTARFQNAAVIDEDFLTSDVLEQLQSGQYATDKNILAGFNRNEGNYFLVYSTDGFNNISYGGPITYSQYRNGLERGLWGYPGQPLNAEAAAKEHISNITLEAIDFEYTHFQALLEDRKQCKREESELVCPLDVEGVPNKNDYRDILDGIVGDTNFVCPVIDFMKKLEKSEADESQFDGSADEMMNDLNAPKQFLYKFLPRSTQTPWPEWLGTLHGYEIEFAFGIPLNRSLNYTEEEVELAKMMMKYWANFVKTGNPNYSVKKSDVARNGRETDAAVWPAYEEKREASLVFSIEPTDQKSDIPKAVTYVEEKTKTRQCSFWNDYYPVLQKNIMQTGSKGCVIANASRSSAVSSIATSGFLIHFCILIFFGLMHLPDYL